MVSHNVPASVPAPSGPVGLKEDNRVVPMDVEMGDAPTATGGIKAPAQPVTPKTDQDVSHKQRESPKPLQQHQAVQQHELDEQKDDQSTVQKLGDEERGSQPSREHVTNHIKKPDNTSHDSKDSSNVVRAEHVEPTKDQSDHQNHMQKESSNQPNSVYSKTKSDSTETLVADNDASALPHQTEDGRRDSQASKVCDGKQEDPSDAKPTENLAKVSTEAQQLTESVAPTFFKLMNVLDKEIEAASM
jgi:hypothetical protein